MKILFLILLHTCLASWAILPLPYPTNPQDVEDTPLNRVDRDPRSVQGLSELYSGSQLREMELPHFENSSSTLGYKAGETFSVPPGLRERVDFWKRVYTEFTSAQALLHDTKNLDIIYGTTDFSHIESKKRLSKRRKRRLISRHLRQEKRKIVRDLLTLDNYRDRPLHVPLTLFPLFKLFENLFHEDKYLKAIAQIRSQIGQKDLIVRGFLYGGRYFNEMIDIFEEYNLPKELTRLTLVESGFNLGAVSKVGASGVWQFMRSTGKRYLRIDRAVDERNDPIMATRAAAQLLKKNYERLGTWPLAITAYNHGREGMARAVSSLESTDISVIIDGYKSKTFGFASSNFYPSFLAILEIERDYRKYFGKLLVDSPVQIDSFELKDEIAFEKLATACEMKPDEFKQFNRALTSWVTRGRRKVPKDYRPQVPHENLEKCRKNLSLGED